MRVAVLGAGGPAGVNVCRALSDAGQEVIGIDENRDHLVWAQPFCAATDVSLDGWWFDVAHAQPELLVRWLAEQDYVKLMPSLEVIERCQDKYQTLTRWMEVGLRVWPKGPASYPYWLRASSGTGARGATLVENQETDRHWRGYWRSRGADWKFMVEEYLPGRDFCWTSLWRDGQLIAAFARERLEWIYPHLAPSGRTGTPTISETVHIEGVNRMGRSAVKAIDPHPNGIYCVDLREDKDGIPRPTEINAGRWATTSPLYSELGPNLPDMHVRLAAGENVEVLGDDIYPEGVKLLRHIDCGHTWQPALIAA